MHFSAWFRNCKYFFAIEIFTKGVVYIQIIRWSKSLCVIFEAHAVLRNFWIFKKMFGTLISSTRNQNMLTLYLFCDSMFSLHIFSTHLTLICFKCLLHMKKHLYDVIAVMFVERSLRLNGTWNFFLQKKHIHYFSSQQRYQDFWQLLHNQKFP